MFLKKFCGHLVLLCKIRCLGIFSQFFRAAVIDSSFFKTFFIFRIYTTYFFALNI
jgi:hypothetical protein